MGMHEPRCNTLQHAATRCNILQHTATHCRCIDKGDSHVDLHERDRDCFGYIIVQTYDVGLHSRRPPRVCMSFIRFSHGNVLDSPSEIGTQFFCLYIM